MRPSWAIGSYQPGGVLAHGTVPHHAAVGSDGNTLVVTWDLEARDPDSVQDTVVAVHIDGDLAFTAPASVLTATLPVIGEGPFDVNVTAWPATWPIPDFLPSDQAASLWVRLQWQRSTATDLAGYRIDRSDNGTTGWTAQTTLTQPAVLRTNTLLASGARVQIEGDYAPTVTTGTARTNSALTVTFTATGFTVTDGATVLLTSIAKTGTVPVFDGIRLRITGTPATSETVPLYIGLPTVWTSPAQPAGTKYWRVVALDKAGNASSPTSTVPVTVVYPPSPITDCLVSYHEGSDEIRLTGTLGSGATAVVYSNYFPETETLLDTVSYDTPLASPATLPATLLDAEDLEPGVYRFVARAVLSGLDDGTTVEQTITLPYVPASLPVPGTLAVVSLPAGQILLSWFSDEAPAWQVVGPGGTEAVTPEVDGQQHQVTLTSAVVGTTDGEVLLTLRAVSGSRLGTAASITGVVDSTAPGAPSALAGVAF